MANVDRSDVEDLIERVRISSDDRSALFLSSKLIAGTDITLNTLDAGGSEVLEINASGGGGDAVDIDDSGSNLVDDVDLIDVLAPLKATNPTGSDVDLDLSLSSEFGVSSGDLIISSSGVTNAMLANSSITVAGTSVSLGGSVSIALADLSDIGTTSATDGHVIASDGTDFDSEAIATLTENHVNLADLADVNTTVDNSKLTNSSVTVAGNSVSLGGTTAVAAGDLSNINLGTLAAGELLIYDNTANEFVDATLTAGNAVTITNADGSVTVAVDASALAGTLLSASGGALDVDESSIDHDVLTNFVANEHINHSNVSIFSGAGLSGGGDITASRTIAMAINNMTSLGTSPAGGDLIAIYDSSAGSHKEMSVTELANGLAGTLLSASTGTLSVDESSIDHDALTNFVSNEHVDHSTISISSGNGLTGGGDITSSRTLSADADTGISVSSSGIAIDETVLKDGGAKELDAADLAGALGTEGQVLTSTGSAAQWEDAGGGASELSDLSDASVSTPSDGDLLIYNNGTSQFENETLNADDIGDVSADSNSSAHHSKTSSASEISDVSPDTTSDAHHSKTSSASELSDVSADSVTDAHHAQTTASDLDGDGTTASGGNLDLDEAVIKDGGTKEIDASEFAGSSGTDGQVLTSTGSAAQWESPSGGGSAITFDVDDDGTNESTDLTEIATVGTTNASGNKVITEPSADKMKVFEDREWPSQRVSQLNTISASSQSTVDFDSNIDSSFTKYRFEIDSWVAANDGVDYRCRMTNDGGSSWISSSYRYVAREVSDGPGVGTDVSTSASEIQLMNATNAGSASGEAGSMTIWLSDPSNSSLHTHIYWQMTYVTTDFRQIIAWGSGRRDSAEANDGMRFLHDSGNVSSGEFKLYGIG